NSKLDASMRRELGNEYGIRYLRMPGEDDPGYPTWSAAIRQDLASLDGGAVVAGHSVGGTTLVATLAEQPPEAAPAALVLIAAPFVGPGGWPGDELELPADLGARLPQGMRVHVFHG